MLLALPHLTHAGAAIGGGAQHEGREAGHVTVLLVAGVVTDHGHRQLSSRFGEAGPRRAWGIILC